MRPLAAPVCKLPPLAEVNVVAAKQGQPKICTYVFVCPCVRVCVFRCRSPKLSAIDQQTLGPTLDDRSSATVRPQRSTLLLFSIPLPPPPSLTNTRAIRLLFRFAGYAPVRQASSGSSSDWKRAPFWNSFSGTSRTRAGRSVERPLQRREDREIINIQLISDQFMGQSIF
ncbi:extracellular triacylglycerol lipase precursor [Anopheles sinensis]|uniref:Extracellular triacylglycerol lipase n=1 Tax=Anopheles sinensis TaxID=74873 RepID=A0A084VIT6_ANOSI|nr:extracellular triacylglycerol lipase precursor [Anopheles sinensis]